MDAINNGIINGSIDHGSRFKLPGPTAKAHVILQPFAATRLLVLVGEPAGKRSDFLQSLKMCRSCLFPIPRSATWNGLSAWSRSSADLFDSSMLSRSAASLSRALLHRNWPKMQSCCNIQQLRPFSIFRCARDSELAWSKHFCLLLMPSSIVSFSPSSQDALVVAYLLPMVATNPESSINTLTSMKLLSSSHSSPIPFPHVSTESRYVKILITHRNHWTSLDSDHLRSYATARHGLGVHLHARCSGLDAGFALKRQQNWELCS